MTTVQAQVFGFTDCQDTRKAQRFFKERGISVHFVDLKERPAARGELRRFAEKLGAGALIDLERALTEPRLLRTPLVRCGGRVAIGHAPETWQAWVEAGKQNSGKPA